MAIQTPYKLEFAQVVKDIMEKLLKRTNGNYTLGWLHNCFEIKNHKEHVDMLKEQY
jgi:hypothetical protein